jgi:hypothetical protein
MVGTSGAGDHAKIEGHPMQRRLPVQLSPRCGAHCWTTGQPCQQAAMPNGRCRMHGGRSTGAPKGDRNNFRHGRIAPRRLPGDARSEACSRHAPSGLCHRGGELSDTRVDGTFGEPARAPRRGGAKR